MSFKTDFEDTSGWNAVDTNVKLNTAKGREFLAYLKGESVDTIIRYYASSPRPKTLSKAEAKLLLDEGFWLLPVYQDNNRLISDFGSANGEQSAINAKKFATDVGQPKGTTILFAVDADFSPVSIDSHIIPYFEAINDAIGDDFSIGAYGSGAVLGALSKAGLISVAWLSMSRLFQGTQTYFYSNAWGLRQLPLPLTHAPTGIGYDKNILAKTPAELGAYSSTGAGAPGRQADDDTEAHLGQSGHALRAADRSATYVATEGLNFRETPGGTVIRPLTIAEPVTDLGAAGVAGWRKVEIGGVTGVVSDRYLRAAAAPEVESLIRATVDEWLRFGKGTIPEDADPQYKYVGEMWQALGLGYDGLDRDQPWSAAFISWVVREAGPAYAAFKFDAAHSQFSHDAIQARILNQTAKPFWGYRITELKPKLGDIIHRNRAGNSYTFDYAEDHSRFFSHSDIVVEVRANVVRVMGGNVGHTVSMSEWSGGDDIQEYELTGDGYLAPGQKIIALLANRAMDIG